MGRAWKSLRQETPELSGPGTARKPAGAICSMKVHVSPDHREFFGFSAFFIRLFLTPGALRVLR